MITTNNIINSDNKNQNKNDKTINDNNSILNQNPLEYCSRKLDICGICNLKYNIGDRIPRILINCGHTYCTSCLSKYYRKQRIRCPCCKKLVKNLESVEQLPLNITIFGELVQNDSLILDLIESNGVNGQTAYNSICSLHDKQKHFFCSYHENNFCRECMKLSHKEDRCCVIDLFDISKLFALNEQNNFRNSLIVKARNKSNVADKSRMNEEFFIANC